MMRFVGDGPVASIHPPLGGDALALGGARFTRDGIRVECSGPAGGDARLEVFDVIGRRLLATELRLTGGPHDAVVPGSATLPAGLYLMRLRSGSAVAHARVVVTR
jgi:hypothetical protein